MNELPEAIVISAQCRSSLLSKRIADVIVGQSPHKLSWYYGEPAGYVTLMKRKFITDACSWGGMVEIAVEDRVILISEGAGPRYHAAGEKRPAKHQLLFEFEDDSALSISVQMYGGMGCFMVGTLENQYYQAAKEKPSPLGNGFNERYFEELIEDTAVQNLSAKAFLATEQRIPGLGNGVLQDILFNAGIHPKRKLRDLSPALREALFQSIRTTLKSMVDGGGRDTEKDLYGKPGKYMTILSKNTVDLPCMACGTPIRKEAYLGGSIYYCPQCQPL